MAKLEIVKDGHPALKKSAKRIKKVTDEIQTLANDMLDTLSTANGVGLAANQVAVPIRMIAVMHAPDDIRIHINPRITKYSDELEYSDEGCLSFPLLYGNVGRSVKITVCSQNLDLKNVKFEAEGFLARIFQHEIDHLNGITFTQRAEEGSLRQLIPEQLEATPDEPQSEETHPDTDSAAPDETLDD